MRLKLTHCIVDTHLLPIGIRCTDAAILVMGAYQKPERGRRLNLSHDRPPSVCELESASSWTVDTTDVYPFWWWSHRNRMDPFW
mmetsp:Transcript_10853/g.12771  ORF Transcript_10853/g.12771 Transcript_10853/m.12771 type:complete len:84 (+) Transcript_10853:545-796(+)